MHQLLAYFGKTIISYQYFFQAEYEGELDSFQFYSQNVPPFKPAVQLNFFFLFFFFLFMQYSGSEFQQDLRKWIHINFSVFHTKWQESMDS